MTIWVKLPGLDFKYWGPKGLNKIGSVIGKPLMVDRNTERKIGLNFARLVIEVEVDTELPNMVYFKNDIGLLIEQKINMIGNLCYVSTVKKMDTLK